MSNDELMQWAGVIAGAGVVGAAAYGFVRFARQLDTLWPETAARYGLTHTRTKEGGALTGSKQTDTLSGPTLSVVSTHEQVGNTRRRGTVVVAKGKALAPMRCEVSRTRPKATLHLVTTGDAKFDAMRFVLSESKEQVKALLTPQVRAALLRCPQWTLHVACDGAQVVVSFGEVVTTTAELAGPIDVALAMTGAPS